MQYFKKFLDAFIYIIKYIFILFFVLIGAAVLLGSIAESLGTSSTTISTILLIITIVVSVICLCLPYFILKKKTIDDLKKCTSNNIFNKISIKANALINKLKPFRIILDKMNKLFIGVKNAFAYFNNVVSKIKNKYLIQSKPLLICIIIGEIVIFPNTQGDNTPLFGKLILGFITGCIFWLLFKAIKFSNNSKNREKVIFLKHFDGLNIPKNKTCKLISFSDRYEFAFKNNKVCLPKEQVADIYFYGKPKSYLVFLFVDEFGEAKSYIFDPVLKDPTKEIIMEFNQIKLKREEEKMQEAMIAEKEKIELIQEIENTNTLCIESMDNIKNYLINAINTDYTISEEQNNENYKAYKEGKAEGIPFFLTSVINKIPNNIGSNADISYNDETRILIINYPIPDFELISTLPKEVKLVKGEIKKTYYPESVVKKIYDDFIYQIIFAVVNAIYIGDIYKHINNIVINGIANTIDRSVGKSKEICVASLQISRDEFDDINFSLIDPKQCFVRLKGISAPKLYDLTPIAPIMQTNKDDKRFVEAYDVAKNIDVGTNLAAMDWQDFENLIRELFEWKFSSNGGECKITQASRDGGVDAIAFDPDPILGGKIIIQAKRYTNVVGVSAVRDLYGTLINEGASKGILITTSDYGSDAHKFAKGKPITLLNGNNLLHLLNEMGTKAYINIKEAKKILKEEKK